MIVPGVVLKPLGEDRFRLITQVFKDVYETAERYKNLTEVAIIALKITPKVTNAATIIQSASRQNRIE